MDNSVEKATQIVGMMDQMELGWLHNIAQEMDSIVEIGCYKGRSTHALASGCRGHLYAVDPWDWKAWWDQEEGETYETFLRNMQEFSNLTPLRMLSAEAAASDLIPPMVDMVFIDGDHSFEVAMQDLTLWAPRAKKLVAGHDLYHNECPGVEKALCAFYGVNKCKLSKLVTPKVGRGPYTIFFIEKSGGDK
jgi:predicted O-methyltransferase YrrM